MHRMEDDVAMVFTDRSKAVTAVEEMAHRGLAGQHLVKAVHTPSPLACEIDTDRAVFRAVAKGVVIGIVGGVAAGAVLMWLGMLASGTDPRLGAVLLGGGYGGFAAGVFFGFVGGAVATQRLLYEEERWGDVHLEPGEVLVVLDPHGDRAGVREICGRHGGRHVDAPPHHELAA